MKANILVVDDKKGARILVKDYLGEEFKYYEAEDKGSCLKNLQANAIDLVILDYRLPGVEGFDLLQRIKKDYPTIPIVMLTSYADYPKAVESIKLGAFDFIPKEKATGLLPVSVAKAINTLDFVRSNVEFNQQQATDNKKTWFLRPNNASYNLIYNEIERFASSDMPFLLCGETGVGKDVFAQYIHQKSGRKGSFVRVDCGELDASFLRSELFGFEKGAYTGAEETRVGKIELADQGTLFLDEISDLSYELQGKLRTVLEKKRIERLGSNEIIEVDFRLIAATNVDLREAMEQNKFRKDLFFRLMGGKELTIPSIRDNKDVIIGYANFFIEQLNKKHNFNFILNNELMDKYLAYSWPGNIREIKAIVQRDFFDKYYDTNNPSNTSTADPDNKSNITSQVQAIEKSKIKDTLQKANYNVSNAAKILDIKRQTLQYKIKKYEIGMP